MKGVRVLYNGINVTPQSLFTSSPESKSAARARKASGDAPTKRPSAATGGGVAPRKKSSLSAEAQQSAAAAAAAVRTEGGHGGAKSTGRRKREGQAEEQGLTEEDLNAPITVGLSETPTMILLEIQGSVVATDLRDFGR